MKIKEMWIVTRPTQFSELDDILFKCDINDLYRQFKGGLHPGDIHGIYTKEKEAMPIAIYLLDKADN